MLCWFTKHRITVLTDSPSLEPLLLDFAQVSLSKWVWTEPPNGKGLEGTPSPTSPHSSFPTAGCTGKCSGRFKHLRRRIPHLPGQLVPGLSAFPHHQMLQALTTSAAPRQSLQEFPLCIELGSSCSLPRAQQEEVQDRLPRPLPTQGGRRVVERGILTTPKKVCYSTQPSTGPPRGKYNFQLV